MPDVGTWGGTGGVANGTCGERRGLYVSGSRPPAKIATPQCWSHLFRRGISSSAALRRWQDERESLRRKQTGEGVNHYATLGVDATSTSAEIKAAYFKKAQESHPDHVDSTDGGFCDGCRARFPPRCLR